MANKDDYLTEYRQFFEEFANTVEPNDQLPVKLGSYKFINSEVVGGIVDWCLQYLNRKSCPSTLVGPLIKITIEEIRMACKKHPIACGFNPNENVYEPLKLMQTVMSKVNEVCLRYLDNSQLDTLPAPPTVAPPMTSECASRNTRRRMEDRHVVIHDLNGMFNIPDTSPTSYYAIFDGHAGPDAASYSAAHLHQFLVESEFYPTDPERALKDAFLRTDEFFLEKSKIESFRSGTTAVCALLRPKEETLYVAWVGDSQALLVNRGKVLQIVKPHKPCREDEKDRIEANGGCVMFWGMWRVNGQLAVSRAIGDLKLKPYVTAEPDIVAVPLDGNEEFLIMACDGLWDFVSEDDAAIAVYKRIKENPENIDSIAECLSDLAKQEGSRDNISVIVIFLKDPSKIAKKLSSDWGWTSLQQPSVTMETGVDNTNINNSASNNAFDLFDVFQKRGTLNPFNSESDFKPNGTDKKPSDLFCFDRPSNGKRSADEFDEEDDDFGPETDIDAVDDGIVSPTISSAKALIEGNGNDEKMDTLDVDFEVQRQQSSEFDPTTDQREETPTPPADSVLDSSGLADNVAESEDSEDEWNYYKVDPKQKETIPPLETINTVSDGTDSQNDEMSQLNPDAKEFVPVSPTRVAVSPTPFSRDLVDDPVIAQSPRRVVPMDISVPSPDEFQFEAKQRPSELFDELNGDKTQNQNGHQLSSQEIMQNLLNGKDVSEIEFHPQNIAKPINDNYFGDNLIENHTETDNSKENISPSEEPTESSLSPVKDESDFAGFVPKPQDPMSMSFYQDKEETGFSTNPFDLNKVQVLPENLDDFIHPEVAESPIAGGDNAESPIAGGDNAESPLCLPLSPSQTSVNDVSLQELGTSEPKSPVPDVLSPLLEMPKSPLPEGQSPVCELDTKTPGTNELDVARSSVEDTRSPVEDIRPPVEDTRSPVEDTRSPVEDTRSPVEDTRSPVEDTRSPVEEENRSLLEIANSPVCEFSPSPVCEVVQSPQSPVCEVAKSPIEVSESPVCGIAKSPMEAPQSPVCDGVIYQVEKSQSPICTLIETPLIVQPPPVCEVVICPQSPSSEIVSSPIEASLENSQTPICKPQPPQSPVCEVAKSPIEVSESSVCGIAKSPMEAPQSPVCDGIIYQVEKSQSPICTLIETPLGVQPSPVCEIAKSPQSPTCDIAKSPLEVSESPVCEVAKSPLPETAASPEPVCDLAKSPVLEVHSPMDLASPVGPLSPKSPIPELTGLVSPDITASIKDENISGEISETPKSPLDDIRSPVQELENEINKSPLVEDRVLSPNEESKEANQTIEEILSNLVEQSKDLINQVSDDIEMKIDEAVCDKEESKLQELISDAIQDIVEDKPQLNTEDIEDQISDIANEANQVTSEAQETLSEILQNVTNEINSIIELNPQEIKPAVVNISLAESEVPAPEINSFLERSQLPEVTSPLSPTETQQEAWTQNLEIKCETVKPEFPVHIITSPSEDSKGFDTPPPTPAVIEKQEPASPQKQEPASPEKIVEAVEKFIEKVETTPKPIAKATIKSYATSPKKPLGSKPSPTSPSKPLPSKTATPTARKTPTATRTYLSTPKPKSTTTTPTASPRTIPAKTTPKPRTTTTTPTTKPAAKPLANGDIKPAAKTTSTLLKKTTTSTVGSKPSSAATKTCPPKPAAARPSSVATSKPASVTRTSLTARPPVTTAAPRPKPASSVLKTSSTAAITKTATSRPASSGTTKPSTPTAKPRPPPTSVTAKPRVPLTRPLTKAPDTEKQIKETANKQLSAARTATSRTTSSATRNTITSAAKKIDTKASITSRTTTTKSTMTTKSIAKKPTTLTKTAVTKPAVEQNGVVNVIQEITTSVVSDDPQLLKDNSPVGNGEIDNSKLEVIAD